MIRKKYIDSRHSRSVIWLALFFTHLLLFMFLNQESRGDGSSVNLYDVIEIPFQGSEYLNPYTTAPNSVVKFSSPGNKVIEVPLFWNGGNEWLVRVAPTVAGRWNYRVISGDTKINGLTGFFNAGNKIGGLDGHGMIQIDHEHPHKFKYSDGTPFFFLGHSIDWNRQGKLATGEYENILKARRQQGFTVLVGYAGPGLNKPIFASNESGPPCFDNDLDKLNPSYFQEVDRRLQIAVSNGFAVTIALGFADQGIWEMDQAKLERIWKYVVARYGAYPILWQPIGEYDDASKMRAREIGQLTDELDTYNHPMSMHPKTTSAEYAGESWFDFIIHQTLSAAPPIDLIRKEYLLGLPIVEEEHRITDPNLVRKAAWRHYTNGAYYTLTEANYVISDERTKQLSYLFEFFINTNFQKLEPHQELVNAGDCLAYPGNEYVIYLPEGGSVIVDLSDAPHILTKTWFNPKSGKIEKKETIKGGKHLNFKAPDKKEWVLYMVRNSKK